MWDADREECRRAYRWLNKWFHDDWKSKRPSDRTLLVSNQVEFSIHKESNSTPNSRAQNIWINESKFPDTYTHTHNCRTISQPKLLEIDVLCALINLVLVILSVSLCVLLAEFMNSYNWDFESGKFTNFDCTVYIVVQCGAFMPIIKSHCRYI